MRIPGRIITLLLAALPGAAPAEPRQDDITFVVLRVRSPEPGGDLA